MARATARLETIRRHLNSIGAQYSSNVVFNNVESSIPGSIHFKYTLDNPFLSIQQREFYENNGFLVIKKLVRDEFLDGYCKRFIDICNNRDEVPLLTVQKDIALKDANIPAEDKVYKLQDLFMDEDLFHYCRLPTILEYVECFTGPNITAIHSMLINKPPDSGLLTSRHPLHQDLYYFPFRPADIIVCSWTAMEKVTRQNGCLVVVPGSHKGELLPHSYPNWPGGVNKMYHGIQSFSPDMPLLHLEMEKGDTVFFHPILIHGSGANRTKGYRKAISCHYAASECQYINVKGTLQQEVGKEVMEVAKSKGLDTDDYTLIWKVRARLVQGKEVSM